MKIDVAISSRRSTRAYLPDPVDCGTVRSILEAASRAPSGTNTQPWKVRVLSGEAQAELTRAVLAVRKTEGSTGHKPTSNNTGKSRIWPEPYLSRRRKVGWDLYGLLGIKKGEKQKMWLQHGRNYEFFGAPVGIFFVVDEELARPSWLDLGMYMQNVMLLARREGLNTCPQGAWLHYGDIVHRILGLAEDEVLASGMALGFADPEAPENALITDRVPVDEFATFSGF